MDKFQQLKILSKTNVSSSIAIL